MAYRLVGASACADRITDSLVAIAMESEERNLDISAGLLEASELFCSLKPDTALYRNLTAKLSRAGASNDSSGMSAGRVKRWLPTGTQRSRQSS